MSLECRSGAAGSSAGWRLNSFQFTNLRTTPLTSGKTFHFRIRLANGNIVNTSQWAHDIFQAQYMISQHYPGCVIIQVVNE